MRGMGRIELSTWDVLVGRRVKFHWSRPDLPAFCHIMELIARSPSTSVSWNHLQEQSQLLYSCRAMTTHCLCM